jgi:uncharacterized membrane protein
MLLAIGLLLITTSPGFYVLGFAVLWYCCRVVKGRSKLTMHEPMLV